MAPESPNRPPITAATPFPGLRSCNCGSSLIKLMGIFLVTVMGISVLFSSSVRNLDFRVQRGILNENVIAQPVEVPNDKLLGNLLTSGFDEKSCLSRYQSLLYRRSTPRKPSPYLISKLRSYEALHKKCGPHTDSYNKTVEILKSGNYSITTPDCKYIVWIPFNGLGNQILTLASGFLYALLTDRVLLVDRGTDISDLFCEPFPEASWLLPLDFPLTNEFNDFNRKSNVSYGNLLKRNNSSVLKKKPYVYLHLAYDYDDQDKRFFCDQDQTSLHKIPWLFMKTGNYFVPSLFLLPSFEQELDDLFPDKETVFHFLGRYLFHPTNSVWGLISRYYDAYLSEADVKVGIQIRTIEQDPGPFKHILDQVLSCTLKEDILPQINRQEPMTSFSPPGKQKNSVSVLITSLSPGYLDGVRNLYWENPTVTGEIIAVHQPSHEVYQHTENQNHNRKAWAEMYLLSLTDKLVTSSWSTFGYVAQGLGGVKPWILYKAENRTAPDPACRRGISIEPCFHSPPTYDCKLRREVDMGEVVPHVKHCEDRSWGLKLFGN
ncbi:galactoside 2-alpha-l-fucosyltransferase [Phtheirospermum japonicum]|uniref:Fucosyltransferase n=1 Tax=Phtheirospermum japonicum TaxID=374723 RepID=A0A830BV55_9LAMI|nr:galactoside 2-alpha-l-fucosyltransferase [Phtheirospermum japonicum]